MTAPVRLEQVRPSRLTVLRDVEAAEMAWRALESEAVHSPYQRYEWISAWFNSHGSEPHGQPAIVVASDAHGRPEMLLPLELDRMGPLRVARFAGGKHSNAQMALFRHDVVQEMSPPRLLALLEEAGRAIGGLDALVLCNQPDRWNGIANPIVALPQTEPAASQAYALQLEPDPEALMRRLLGKDSRKKLAKKRRWLLDKAPVELRRATASDEIDTVLDAFFRQKAQRLGSLGIQNPFAGSRTQDFLRRAARSGLEHGRPALELHVLWWGERVAAVFGGCCDGRRLSGTFISFEPDPELMRSSPGELLTQDIVRQSCLRGLDSFDLGIGDVAYKRHYCPIEEPRFDTTIPLSLLGRAAQPMLTGYRQLKTIVKSDDRLLKLARKVVHRVRPTPRA